MTKPGRVHVGRRVERPSRESAPTSPWLQKDGNDASFSCRVSCLQRTFGARNRGRSHKDESVVE